ALGEGEDLDVRPRVRQHVGDLCQGGFQARHRVGRIDAVGELRHEFDAPIGVGRVVLDVVAEDLGVADERYDVVGRVDGGREEPDLVHRSLDAAGQDVVAHLERTEHQQEGAGGEVGQQAGPGGADRDARSGDEGGEAGGLEPEITEDRDHQ